jgi:Intracellular proteinase inhibitor
MKACFLLPLLVCFSLASAAASEEGAREKPGMMTRFLNIFRGSSEPRAANWKRLSLTMRVQPLPVKLSETRQLKVSLQLANRSKRLIQLEFPTTQRIEVLVRNADGKMVEQWSEDQSFAPEPTIVAINPNERLEYIVSVSTRDMVAGQPYMIEGFFPNYEQLKVSQTIVPEK